MSDYSSVRLPFGSNYTNQDIRDQQVTVYDLGLLSNYAMVEDTPKQVVLDNTTASYDQQEIIMIRRRNVGQIQHELNIQYPSPQKGGILYAYEAQQTVVEELQDGTRIDHPVRMYLTVVHDKSGCITDQVLDTQLRRLISAIPVNQNGLFLLTKTARGALRPTE